MDIKLDGVPDTMINNCYAIVNADSEMGRVGGIVGRNLRNNRPDWAVLTQTYKVAIQNCYAITDNIGELKIVGGLIGYMEYSMWFWDFSNSYYYMSGGEKVGVAVGTWYNDVTGSMNPNNKTKEWIKENIGKTTLNTYYKPDEFNKNDGFPVLNWEYEKWK